jgi:hypothetical protein
MALAGKWRMVAGIVVVLATIVMMPGFAGNSYPDDLLFWSYILHRSVVRCFALRSDPI